MASKKHDPLAALSGLVNNPDAELPDEDEEDPEYVDKMNQLMALAQHLADNDIFNIMDLLAACQDECRAQLREMLEDEE